MVVEYRNNSKEMERLKQDLIYWSDNLYYRQNNVVKKDIFTEDLPAKLQHAYKEQLGDDYQISRYLVEYKGACYVAFVETFEKDFADVLCYSMDLLWLRMIEAVTLHSEMRKFEAVKFILMQSCYFSDCHELIMLLPAGMSKGQFNRIANRLIEFVSSFKSKLLQEAHGHVCERCKYERMNRCVHFAHYDQDLSIGNDACQEFVDAGPTEIVNFDNLTLGQIENYLKEYFLCEGFCKQFHQAAVTITFNKTLSVYCYP